MREQDVEDLKERMKRFGLAIIRLSEYWLEVSLAAGLISEKDAGGLVREANELLAIVVSSIRTAKRAS